MDKVMTWYDDV